MNTQNQIKRTLSEATSIEYVCGLLESKEILHRSELAALVCRQFGFYDVGGQEQWGGCLKGLRDLEAAGSYKPRSQFSPAFIEAGLFAGRGSLSSR